MFIESKKAYAIFKAVEAASIRDDADYFSAVVRKSNGNIVVSFCMGFGYDVLAENVISVCQRNGISCNAVEGGAGYGGLRYTVIIPQ